MPEVFRDAGYSTNLIGKWHLGFFKKSYTATQRGFDYHYGYNGGYIDYYDHTLFMAVLFLFKHPAIIFFNILSIPSGS